MKRLSILAALLLAWFATASTPAWAKLKVVGSTQDLAALAQAVGGDDINVSYIARGDLDPHFINAKPSFMVKLASANLLVFMGMDLEIGWLPPLITGARNPKIQLGAPGYLDASAAIQPIEVPTGTVDRSRGDLHPQGNPHYLLDPDNGRRVARAIEAKLELLDPKNAADYQANLAAFEKKLTDKEAEWKTEMAPLKGVKVIGYHSTFDYLCKVYGMDLVGFVEPRPGIPPTPSHTLQMAQKAKAQGVKFVLVEPYHDPRDASPIARMSSARVLEVPTEVGGMDGVVTYFDLFDHIVQILTHPSA